MKLNLAYTPDVLEAGPVIVSDSEIGRHTKIMDDYDEVGFDTKVHPLILMGVVSRESKCRNVIKHGGCGVAQIKKRHCNEYIKSGDGLDIVENLHCLAELLIAYHGRAVHNYPDWKDGWHLRAAFMAYSSHFGRTRLLMDEGDHYSFDVMRRMIYLGSVFYWPDVKINAKVVSK